MVSTIVISGLQLVTNKCLGAKTIFSSIPVLICLLSHIVAKCHHIDGLHNDKYYYKAYVAVANGLIRLAHTCNPYITWLPPTNALEKIKPKFGSVHNSKIVTQNDIEVEVFKSTFHKMHMRSCLKTMVHNIVICIYCF